MITRVYINEALLFEAAGDLLVTKDVFKIAGFDKPVDSLEFKVVGDAVEVRMNWNLNDRLSKEEIEELRSTSPPKKIPVIKALRDRTGLGLRESKDMVDAFCAANNI